MSAYSDQLAYGLTIQDTRNLLISIDEKTRLPYLITVAEAQSNLHRGPHLITHISGDARALLHEQIATVVDGLELKERAA